MTEKLLFFSIISFAGAYLLTPWAKRLAVRWGMVDEPNERKMHESCVPYGGGIAIFAGFLLSFILIGNTDREMLGFILGAVIIVATGIYDDFKGLNALPKFLLQACAAIVAISFGIDFDMSLILRGNLEQFQYLAIPLTFVWIVGIANAINLIDGLDGLAAGVSTISAFTLACVSWVNGAHGITLLSLILGAASLGFLPHNFKTRVFMGDAGSMFLGYSLATISIMGSVKLAAAFSMFVPILILAIPIFDTLFAIVRRLSSGKKIYESDKKHLHHRLLEMGFSSVQTVIFIYLLSFSFGGLAVLSAMLRARYAYLTFATALLIVLLGSLVVVFVHQRSNGHGKK